MTSGVRLKIALGLKNHKTVYISRLILPHTQNIVVVYYNTLRKDSTFSKQRCTTPPFSGMAYSGKDLHKNRLEKPRQTPLIDIESWNGDLNNYIVVAVDVAYSFRVSSKAFTHLPESKLDKKISVFYPSLKLKELTLTDLSDTSSISDFGMIWRRDKNRLLGGENITSKLIDCVIDEANKWVTFQFLSEATELKGKNPSTSIDSKYKFYKGDKYEVEPGSGEKKINRSKSYEIQIRVLDFFEWLKTFEGEEIKPSNLKEILEISDIQVSSTSPAFLFQGTQYWLHQLGGSIVPEDRKPQRWNADHLHGESGTFLTKELFGLLRQMPFFLNPMTSMLNKKLKDRGLI